MRVAIVNDMQMAVEVLRRVVSSVPGYEVAWIAYDGVEAVQKCAADIPDLILMDLIMPQMDGVEATRLIMKYSPCAILVVTATVSGNASKVFDAMGHGALDAVNTPVLGPSGSAEGRDALVSKMATIAKLIGKESQPKAQPPHFTSGVLSLAPLPPLVLIGASTGGPLCIAKILANWPKDITATFVVVQHVDVEFAQGLADWLNEQTALEVDLAREGDKLQAGKVLIAGTRDHLILRPSQRLGYSAEPANLAYRPSVDVFFKSVVENSTALGTAVLLTGMGRDGAEGLLDLKRAGWHTIAQDQETSIVYGMPKAAAELKAAAEILPVDQITGAIANQIMKR